MNKLLTVLLVILSLGSQAMTLEPVMNDGIKSIRLYGPVEEGDSAMLKAFLEANPDINYVSLHSGGGAADEGLEMGYLLREYEIDTVVDLGRQCSSACTFIFAGGAERIIVDGVYKGENVAGKLGFHVGNLKDHMLAEDKLFGVGTFWGFKISAFWVELFPENAEQILWAHARNAGREDPTEIEYMSLYKLMRLGIVTYVHEAGDVTMRAIIGGPHR